MMFVPPLGANNSLRLDQVIKRLRLAPGCKLILDAADARSYASGQSWLDRSGGGHDFFVGATGGSESSDPAFTGTAGTLGAYFALDGGDWFTHHTTNPSWVDNLHKAGAKGGVCAWVSIPAGAAVAAICGDHGGSTANIGFELRATATNRLLGLRVSNGSGSFARNQNSTLALAADTWSFIAVSIDEAAGANGLVFFLNGSSDSFSSTYSSPSSAASTYSLNFGANGNGGSPLPSGSKMGGVMMWEGVAPSAAQFNAIFQATRRRYGI